MSPCREKIILETKNVSREISGGGKQIKTVDRVSFQFHKSSIYNLVGPSGAGKTSLLRLLNRLDDPTAGEVIFAGEPVISYQPTELRKKIGMLFQEPYLFPGTVYDNLNFCCPDKNLDNPGFHLERVGLKPVMAEKEAGDLSVGERQRVALARSLMLDPEVLLLDEPTAALDPSSAQTIERLFISLAEKLCLTLIIVTHNPDQALRLGGETLLLVTGRLVEYGPTEQVLKNPASELGKKYVNRELT